MKLFNNKGGTAKFQQSPSQQSLFSNFPQINNIQDFLKKMPINNINMINNMALPLNNFNIFAPFDIGNFANQPEIINMLKNPMNLMNFPPTN